MIYIAVYKHIFSGSEIKGAPCTRHTHFHGGVHDFRRCAPGVCTFFDPIIMLYIKVRRVHGAISGRTVLWAVHPVSAQNKNLISDTEFFLQKQNAFYNNSWLENTSKTKQKNTIIATF